MEEPSLEKKEHEEKEEYEASLANKKVADMNHEEPEETCGATSRLQSSRRKSRAGEGPMYRDPGCHAVGGSMREVGPKPHEKRRWKPKVDSLEQAMEQAAILHEETWSWEKHEA